MSTLELAPGDTAFVGRDGQKLEIGKWYTLRENHDYRIVARTPHLDAVVQTEWEGVADTVEVSFMYHTGIKWAGEWFTVWHAHWPCTEAEAKKAHRAVVKLLTETCPKPPAGHEYRLQVRAIEQRVEQLMNEALEDDGRPTPEESLENFRQWVAQGAPARSK